MIIIGVILTLIGTKFKKSPGIIYFSKFSLGGSKLCNIHLEGGKLKSFSAGSGKTGKRVKNRTEQNKKQNKTKQNSKLQNRPDITCGTL